MSDNQDNAPKGHARLERNVTLLAVATLVTVAIGGLVQITPLFYLDNTIEQVEGVRPYSPLEQAGRDIYIREGCYSCHSQMIRPFRDEVERYGAYSLAAESMFDHPFQWGSKRTGPDLARVGDRYSDEWHVQHFEDPQSVVPESIMPQYAFLMEKKLKPEYAADVLSTYRMVGDPYTDEMIELAASDMAMQADPDRDDGGVVERYPGAVVSNFDGQRELTEMDALIAESDGPFKRALDRYKYPNRYEDEGIVRADQRSLGLRFLEKLNTRLSDKAQLFGDRVSYADIAIFPFIRQFANTDRDWFDALDLPHLQAWLAGHLESPRFKQIMPKFAQWKTGDEEPVFPPQMARPNA